MRRKAEKALPRAESYIDGRRQVRLHLQITCVVFRANRARPADPAGASSGAVSRGERLPSREPCVWFPDWLARSGWSC